MMKAGPLRTILTKAWPVKGSLEIHDLERNIFLFVFRDENDKRKVLTQSLWSVMNSHLIFKEWPLGDSLDEIDFSTSDFWVQVHNLPLAYLTNDNAMKIASVFDKLVEIDRDGNDNVIWNGFLRLKVSVKVDEPLKMSFNLKRNNKDTLGVSFKYEKLLDFCYHCGRVGHGARDCCHRSDGIKKNVFGPWLRASQQLNKNRNRAESSRSSSQKMKEASGVDEESDVQFQRKRVERKDNGREDTNYGRNLLEDLTLEARSAQNTKISYRQLIERVGDTNFQTGGSLAVSVLGLGEPCLLIHLGSLLRIKIMGKQLNPLEIIKGPGLRRNGL
ncbi:hypothetical protein REPUB_Repub14bG0036000 [Reevesia pubescens]